MKNKFILIYLIISLLTVGCWDSKELNSLAIVMGAAIDLEEPDLYKVTLQTVKTVASAQKKEEGGEGTSSGYSIVSATGKSIFEAARNITTDLDRRNYWPHTQVVFLGQELAKKDIQPAIDFFSRDSQRRTTVYFVYTEEKGKDLLANTTETEPILAQETKAIIKNTTSTGYGVDKNLTKFLQDLYSLSGVALMNKFKTAPKEKLVQGEKPTTETVLDGTAIFFKNKLIDTLTKEETQVVNWLTNNIKTTVISVGYDNPFNAEITVQVDNSKTSLKPIIDGDKYIMKATIEFKGDIVEYSAEKAPDEISLKKLETEIAERIRKEIREVFTKAKTKFKVDLFNFGNNFADKHKYLLNLTAEEWQIIFLEQVELDLEIKPKITFSGMKLRK